MSVPYRRASDGSWVAVMIFVAFALGPIPLFLALPKGTAVVVPIVVIVVGSIGGLWLGFMYVGRVRRRRVGGIRWMLEREGYTVSAEPDDAAKTAALAGMPHLEAWLWLKDGYRNIKWTAQSRDGWVRIFEHQFTTGSGKSTQSHERTVIIRGPVRPEARLYLHRMGRFEHWQTSRSAGADITVGDVDFDKKWRVTGDPAWAGFVLTSPVKRLLADAPKGEIWTLGGGVMAFCFQGYADAESLAVMLRRSRDFVAELHPDVRLSPAIASRG